MIEGKHPMKEKIRTVQAFQCSLCEEVYIDSDAAAKCHKKCLKNKRIDAASKRIARDRERLGDIPRLNATSFEHAWELVIQHARDDMKLNLRVNYSAMSFDRVSDSHNCPLVGGVTNWDKDKKLVTEYLGWRGRIHGEVSIIKRLPYAMERLEDVGLDSLFRNTVSYYYVGYYFRGFHTGTGCPGNKFEIDFYMFLDDFPLIREKYLGACVAHRLGAASALDEFGGIARPDMLLGNFASACKEKVSS